MGDRRYEVFVRALVFQGPRAIVEELAWTLGLVILKLTCEDFAIP